MVIVLQDVVISILFPAFSRITPQEKSGKSKIPLPFFSFKSWCPQRNRVHVVYIMLIMYSHGLKSLHILSDDSGSRFI